MPPNGLPQDHHMLCVHLGINEAKRDNYYYTQLEASVKNQTRGRYSRVRCKDDLNDEGKRLLQEINDYEHRLIMQQIERERRLQRELQIQKRKKIAIVCCGTVACGAIIGVVTWVSTK